MRAKHAAAQFVPISMQGLTDENAEMSIANALGMPTYGKTYDQRAEAKAEARAERNTPEARAERRRKTIERRIQQRERGY